MTTFDEARNARLAAARELAVYRSLADDLYAEWKAFDEAVESKAIRYVKTPKGAEFYNQPVGSPIRPGGGKLSYIRNGPKKKRTSTGTSSAAATATEKETPSKPRIDYTRRTPKASTPETPVASNKPAAPSVPVDKSTLPVNRLTDGDIKKQADELTNSKRKLSGAEQTRLNQLVAEERRRENLAGTGSPNSFSAAGLDKEISKLEKTKRRTPEQNRRLLELRLAQSRQRYALNRTQDQLMVGRKSDSVETVRFAVDVKVHDAVGDGDWDCSHMSDDDLDWFIGKALTGRPSIEKLQQANAMLTEKMSRVEQDDAEGKELTWETT